MHTETDHDPPRTHTLRTFGARAAALTGLFITIGTFGPAEMGTTDTDAQIMIIAEPPNPSTCCAAPPDPT